MLEFFIVTVFIFIFVFLNSLTFIIGSFLTPEGSVFLGTVHWPADYFYYLSQFGQGRNSWFFSFDLFTLDFSQKTLVGWVNVFLGRIFYLLGVNHFLAYQISVVIFTVVFLCLSYLLIREIFPEDKMRRVVAFILFTVNNTISKVVYEGGKTSFSYYYYWFNQGEPFNRLTAVPHQMVGRSSLVLALLLAIWWWRKKKIQDKRYKIREGKKWMILTGLSLSGFVVASVNPVHWVLLGGILFIVSFTIICGFHLHSGSPPRLSGGAGRNFTSAFGSTKSVLRPTQSADKPAFFPFLRHPHLKLKCKLTKIFYRLFTPAFFFFLGGLPMAIYLKKLFSYPPFSQLAFWESTQSVKIGVLDFILGSGPIALLAIFGIFVFLRKKTLLRVLSVVFVILTIGLFFSPIPKMTSIVNVRFLPSVTFLFLACFAAEVIGVFTGRLKKRKSLVTVFVLIIFFLIVAPSYALQIKEKISRLDPNNSYFYLPKKAYETFLAARKVSSPEDNFLVIFPFEASFPGMMVRKGYWGHPLLTVDLAKKKELTGKFFYNGMTEEEMEKFLLLNKISFIIAYPWTAKIDKIGVEKVYDNGFLGVYEVLND